MLMIMLIWDDVDVDDVIVMMCVVYVHGGAVTMMDIHGGGIEWLKSFKHPSIHN